MSPSDTPDDRDAELEKFWNDNYEDVHGFVRFRLWVHGITRQKQLIEDLTSEALTRVMERWDQPMETRRGYAFTVAENLVYRQVGRPREQPLNEEEDEQWLNDTFGASVDRAVLRNNIKRLPPQLQRVMILELMDWTVAEIAEALETKPATISNYKQQAYQRLRRALMRGDADGGRTGPSPGQDRAPRPDGNNNGGS